MNDDWKIGEKLIGHMIVNQKMIDTCPNIDDWWQWANAIDRRLLLEFLLSRIYIRQSNAGAAASDEIDSDGDKVTGGFKPQIRIDL